MSDRIFIGSGDWRAELDREAAALKRLWWRGAEIVCIPEPEANFSFAGSTLAPWANRLRDGRWSLDGAEFQAAVNDRGTGTALHGLVVHTDFAVTTETDQVAAFGHLFGTDAAYPFALELAVRYSVDAGGLTVELAAKNRDRRGLPVVLGSHPYFRLDADSALQVSAATIMVNDAHQLPVGREPLAARGLQTGEPMRVADLQLDDCLTDFSVATDGQIRTRLSRPELGCTIELWQEPRLAYLMAFTRRYAQAGVEYPLTLALEPQSGPADAFRTGESLIWLEPAESISLSWGIAAV